MDQNKADCREMKVLKFGFWDDEKSNLMKAREIWFNLV